MATALERRQCKKIERLEAALKPFADIADLVRHTDVRDGETVYRLPNPKGGYWTLTRKDFRQARAAVSATR